MALLAFISGMRTFLLAAVLGTAAMLHGGEPVSLFNGKDLTGWQTKTDGTKGSNKWTVGAPRLAADQAQLDVTAPEGAMVNLAIQHGDSWDIYSKQEFGSCHLELDVMVPKGSNSGIYLMGEYELQVFDSYGKTTLGTGDMGAIYGASPPPMNACKAPGEWQHIVVDWQAPTFDAKGTKTASAKFLKVELNGNVLHKDLEMKGPTPGGICGKEAAKGPLMFQGNHGAVAYRNIQITPLP